jgi:sigma-E factor negative regulatory protein RseC
MIEETATVVAVEGDYVWVETQVKTTCNSCKASESCPSSTIAKAFSPKPEHIHLQVPCSLVVGQQVKIGISENALLHASTMVYILPLVLFMLCAALIQFILPSLHELLNLGLSSLVALASYWWVSAQSKLDANRRKFAPVFLGATQGQVMTAKHEIPMQKLD